MVGTCKKWLWLLVLLNSCFVVAAPVDYNKQIKEAAVAMVGGAGLKVIGSDSGSVVSIHDVVGVDEGANAEEVAFVAKRDSMVERLKSGSASKVEVMSVLEGVLFPVVSRYKPNKLPSREIVIPDEVKLGIDGPVAIVGYDEFSISWLSLNESELARIGATVFVTHVSDVHQFNSIKSSAPSLKYVPMNADSLLSLSGLRVYPVVLTKMNAFQ